MVASNSKKILQKIRDLSQPNKRQIYKVRYNYKMSDLQAGLGIEQLKKIIYFIKRRKEIAAAYTKVLSGYDLELPVTKKDRDHVFYRFLLKTDKAAILRRHLRANGIEVFPPVYNPLHRYLSLDRNNFQNTEEVYKKVISLPIYPSLKERELLKIIRVLKENLNK